MAARGLVLLIGHAPGTPIQRPQVTLHLPTAIACTHTTSHTTPSDTSHCIENAPRCQAEAPVAWCASAASGVSRCQACLCPLTLGEGLSGGRDELRHTVLRGLHGRLREEEASAAALLHQLHTQGHKTHMSPHPLPPAPASPLHQGPFYLLNPSPHAPGQAVGMVWCLSENELSLDVCILSYLVEGLLHEGGPFLHPTHAMAQLALLTQRYRHGLVVRVGGTAAARPVRGTVTHRAANTRPDTDTHTVSTRPKATAKVLSRPTRV